MLDFGLHFVFLVSTSLFENTEGTLVAGVVFGEPFSTSIFLIFSESPLKRTASETGPRNTEGTHCVVARFDHSVLVLSHWEHNLNRVLLRSQKES